MKIECVFASGDIVGEGPEWHREQECIYWPDINGFKSAARKQGGRWRDSSLVPRKIFSFPFAVNRRAEHKRVIEKKEKKWCKNERRSQSLSFSGVVRQA